MIFHLLIVGTIAIAVLVFGFVVGMCITSKRADEAMTERAEDTVMQTPITLEQVERHLAIDPFFDHEPAYMAETNAFITAFLQRRVLSSMGMQWPVQITD